MTGDRDDLLADLDCDVCARSTAASQRGLSITWHELHFGLRFRPLSARRCSSDEAGWYYLSLANRERLTSGATWDQQLERVGFDCTRSVKRGMGASQAVSTLPVGRALFLTVWPYDRSSPSLILEPASRLSGGLWLERQMLSL